MTKSIFLISISYFRRRKGQNLLVGLCITLSALLFATTLSLLQNIHRPFDVMFDQQKASHILLQYHHAEVNTDKIRSWFYKQPEVKAISEAQPFILLNSPVIFQEQELDLSIQLTERIAQANGLDQVIFLAGTPTTYPEVGEIWLPDHLANSHGIELGDTVGIPTPSGLYPLIVSARLVDPHYVSGFFNPTRAWIAPGSLSFMFPISQLNELLLGVLLHNPASVNKLMERFHQQNNYTGHSLEYALFKSVFLSFYQIISLILLVFSLMALIAALFILYTTLSASIDKDLKLIGLYKTTGFTPRNIMQIYLLHYFLLMLFSLPLALLGSYGLMWLIMKLLLDSVGLAAMNISIFGPFVLTVLIFLIVIGLLVAWESRKAAKVKPVQAIRSDPAIGKHAILLPKEIWKWDSMSVAFLWGMSMLLSNPKRSLFTGMSMILAIFILFFSVHVSHSFASLKDQKAAWGLEDSDLQIKRNEKIALPLEHQSMLTLLKEERQIETLVPFQYVSATLPAKDGQIPQSITGKAYVGEIDALGLYNLSGKHPEATEEIALCMVSARELGKQPGDSIQLIIEGQLKQFLITGIYQDISNLGKGFRISGKAMKNLNPLFKPSFYAIKLSPDTDVSTFQNQLQATYGESMLIEQSVEDRQGVRNIIQAMQAALSLISIFFLVILFAILFNDTQMNIRDYRRSLGVLKTLGMTASQLQIAQVYRFLGLSAICLIIGLPLAYLLSPQIISQLTQNLGLAEFPFLLNQIGNMMIIPGILAFAGTSAWWASRKMSRQWPRHLLAFLAVGLCSLSLSFGQNAAKFQQMDTYFQAVKEKTPAPGFAVVVVKGDKIIFSRGYGQERADHPKPMTDKTVSAIGSLTKSFTALAIMQLVEQGKIELDKAVITYLPEFRTANPARSNQITVRMLLNNSSGLYGGVTQRWRAADEPLKKLMQSLEAIYLKKEPGTSYEYSNAAFSVAGLLISRVSGFSYAEYIKWYILKPLEMLHSSTDPTEFSRLNTISGHNMGMESGIPAISGFDSYEMIPAGSLFRSTAQDLGNYLIALLNKGSFKGRQIIQAASIEALWEPQIAFPGLTIDMGGDGKAFHYGLGWMISEVEDKTLIHHGGSTGTMSSMTVIHPEKRLAASILLNVDDNFLNSYAYPSAFSILNNLFHLLEDEPMSDFGNPRVPDPTINDYILPSHLQSRFLGTYRFNGKGDSRNYQGTNLIISLNQEGKMIGELSRGNQHLSAFECDFVHEAMAISRNIGTPKTIRFIVQPKGEISGLYLADSEFRKLPTDFLANYEWITLKRHSLGFHLHKDWAYKLTDNDVKATKADKKVELRVGILENRNLSFSQWLSLYFPEHQEVYQGQLQTEIRGSQVWQYQSFASRKDQANYQHMFMQNEALNCYILLSTPFGQLTTELQQNVNFLMDSMR